MSRTFFILHKGLMEARFCTVPYDSYVSMSPLLAEIHRNLIAAMCSANLPAGRSPDSWAKWLRVDESRREWHVALDRAASASQWRTADQAGKYALASSLLAPFYVDQDVLDKFVEAANSRTS